MYKNKPLQMHSATTVNFILRQKHIRVFLLVKKLPDKSHSQVNEQGQPAALLKMQECLGPQPTQCQTEKRYTNCQNLIKTTVWQVFTWV